MSINTAILPQRPDDWRTDLRKKAWSVLGFAAAATMTLAVAVGTHVARPLLAHMYDHAYTIIGLGLFDAAMFVHSLFTGLLVTGISFIVFELKVSEKSA